MLPELFVDGVLVVLGLDAGFLGGDGLGLVAGLAVVRDTTGVWGFSTSFMSSVSERCESAGEGTSCQAQPLAIPT